MTPSHLAADQAAYLDQINRTYCAYNQTERSDSTFMAANAHPFAADYQQLRAFFDSLKFCCNASARYFSFKSETENSEYWAPDLEVSWYPDGAMKRFGHVYPASPFWDDYLNAAAKEQWVGSEPRLKAGQWIVTTKIKDLISNLKKLANTPGDSFEIQDYCDAQTTNALTLHIKTPAQHEKIIALLRQFHASFILPPRETADDETAKAPVPFAEKTLMFGTGDKVIVKPKHVLVPLIRDDAAVMTNAVNDLVDCLDQGFPFANASNWLEKCLTKKAFNELKRKYAA